MNKRTYDQALLQYYYGKDLEHLKKTGKKYKRYAEMLAKKCENLKGKIEVLDSDFKQASIFYQNAANIRLSILKKERDFENGVKQKDKFFWCPPDDEEDEEELAEEFRREENIKRLQNTLETLQGVSRWYMPLVERILEGRSLTEVLTQIELNPGATPESLETEIAQIVTATKQTTEVEIPQVESKIKTVQFKHYVLKKTIECLQQATPLANPDLSDADAEVIAFMKPKFRLPGTVAVYMKEVFLIDSTPPSGWDSYYPSRGEPLRYRPLVQEDSDSPES